AAVKAAIKSGRLSESRIDESVRRILAAKQFALVATPDPEAIFRTVDSPEHRELANEIARRALTLVREQKGILPILRDSKIALIIVSDFPDYNPMLDLDRELRSRAEVVSSVVIDSRTRAEEIVPIANADVAVIAFAVRARSG